MRSPRGAASASRAMFALIGAFFLFAPTASFPQNAPSATALYRSGREAMLGEDYYLAAEHFLEALRLNPTYAEPVASLAECFYALGEFDQALSYVRRSRLLSRGNLALANLEAFILIAMGDLSGADAIVRETLTREPYNKEAMFAAAELDVARGKTADAAARYREATRRFPDDRRALLSLALVLGSLGDIEGARSFAARAKTAHPDDHRVYYYAAYLDAASGRLTEAAAGLVSSLSLKSDYGPARSLLGSVRYRLGEWEEAARLADQAIGKNRDDLDAWYLKGLSYARLGRAAEARSVLSAALTVGGGDEFIRFALEDLVLSTTAAEAAERAKLAAYHIAQGEEYRRRNYADQALFEYRRALRLDPYSKTARVAFADLLRSMGYPSRQLEELRMLQEIGAGDRAINDAVETYDSLLADALHRRWGIDSLGLEGRHWKIAVVSLATTFAVRHVDAGRVAANYVRDILVHDDDIAVVDIPVEQASFATAFRSAREAGADYFLILETSESERDLALSGGLYVARTGSPAASFGAFRTGNDRLRNAGRTIAQRLSDILPFRARLVVRKAGQALIDKGKYAGVSVGAKYEIVKDGAAVPRAEGVGLDYPASSIAGFFVADEVDEDVSAGSLTRNGFFDRISEGDEVMAARETVPANESTAAQSPAVDPELRFLLRNLR